MKLTKDQAKQILALKNMKDEDIDFSDIPEKTDWSKAVVGKFYRPVYTWLGIVSLDGAEWPHLSDGKHQSSTDQTRW
jgi:hypothetical protein